ncbi:MAG: hypothetical protein ACKVQJ_04750 [Pyrinomonadaceae bacterium]
MFEDYDRGEKKQKTGMLQARLIIFGVIVVVSLIALGVSKWSEYSLHEKLAKRHEQTTAQFINNFKNGKGSKAVYAITYIFTVNGKTYQNVGFSKINPKYPRGIVWYNPDDPEENELQPIPKDEEYIGTDR